MSGSRSMSGSDNNMGKNQKSSEAHLARVRDNQRRSRARRKQYLQELEDKLRRCESSGAEASAEMQDAARKVLEENARLRLVLQQYGLSEHEINARAAANEASASPPPLANPPASTAGRDLVAAFSNRKDCSTDGSCCGGSGKCGVGQQSEGHPTQSNASPFAMPRTSEDNSNTTPGSEASGPSPLSMLPRTTSMDSAGTQSQHRMSVVSLPSATMSQNTNTHYQRSDPSQPSSYNHSHTAGTIDLDFSNLDDPLSLLLSEPKRAQFLRYLEGSNSHQHHQQLARGQMSHFPDNQSFSSHSHDTTAHDATAHNTMDDHFSQYLYSTPQSNFPNASLQPPQSSSTGYGQQTSRNANETSAFSAASRNPQAPEEMAYCHRTQQWRSVRDPCWIECSMIAAHSGAATTTHAEHQDNEHDSDDD